MRLELLFGPVVERVREQEAATRAAPIIDWKTGERRMDDAPAQARPMHVDDAVECCVIAANLAGDCLSACRPETELIGWHYRPLDAHAQNDRNVTTGAQQRFSVQRRGHQGSVNFNFPLIPGWFPFTEPRDHPALRRWAGV